MNLFQKAKATIMHFMKTDMAANLKCMTKALLKNSLCQQKI